jgi:hypothetical protein
VSVGKYMDRLLRRTAIDEINKYMATDEIVVLHGAHQVSKLSKEDLLSDDLLFDCSLSCI